jgi:hypothetical protein
VRYRDLNKPKLTFFRYDVSDIIPKKIEKKKKQYYIRIKNPDQTISDKILVYASSYGYYDSLANFYHRTKVVYTKSID